MTVFDSYRFRAVTERVTKNVNVTEHRAPTDESVKLLREMEAEAQSRIVKSTRVADMGFECVIHSMRDSINSQIRFAVIYSLNGKKHRVDHDVEDMGSRVELTRKTVDSLIDAVAKDMAEKLLIGAFKKLPDHLWT